MMHQTIDPAIVAALAPLVLFLLRRYLPPRR
jgi:hypothetical protein